MLLNALYPLVLTACVCDFFPACYALMYELDYPILHLFSFRIKFPSAFNPLQRWYICVPDATYPLVPSACVQDFISACYGLVSGLNCWYTTAVFRQPYKAHLCSSLYIYEHTLTCLFAYASPLKGMSFMGLHCSAPLHFTSLHFTSLHFTPITTRLSM
jgi:hypothetical protein